MKILLNEKNFFGIFFTNFSCDQIEMSLKIFQQKLNQYCYEENLVDIFSWNFAEAYAKKIARKKMLGRIKK